MMGKTRIVTLLASVMLVVASFAFSTATASEQKVFKWKLQSFVPAGVDSYRFLGPDLADLVRKMSNGRLDIECYAAGELVKGKEIMDAVSKGVIEAGIGLGSYWSGKIPVAGTEYGLPYSFRNKTEMQTFLLKKGYLEILREAYAKRNIYYVGLAIDNGFALVTKKPINTLEDLKKMKLRATGAGALLLKELGASVVSLAGPELYTALATGVIDGCVYGGFKTLWSVGIHEQTKYIMWPKIMAVHAPWNFLINMKSWNSLPDDLKVIVEAAWMHQEVLNFINKYNSDIEYLKKMQEYGLKVVTLPEAEQAKMREAAEVVWAKIAAKDAYCAKVVKLMRDYLKFVEH